MQLLNLKFILFMSVDKGVFCWYTFDWTNESYALTIKYMFTDDLKQDFDSFNPLESVIIKNTKIKLRV